MRMSAPPMSTSSEVRSDIASIANVVEAIRPILSAIAACSPIGAPHCTRSRAQVREM